jgi:hypothetical protein
MYNIHDVSALFENIDNHTSQYQDDQQTHSLWKNKQVLMVWQDTSVCD